MRQKCAGDMTQKFYVESLEVALPRAFLCQSHVMYDAAKEEDFN